MRKVVDNQTGIKDYFNNHQLHEYNNNNFRYPEITQITIMILIILVIKIMGVVNSSTHIILPL